MEYLLDTCILVAMLKNQYRIREKIISVGAKKCYVSEISIAELYYGAYHSANPLKHLQEVSFVASHFSVIPVSNVLETWGRNKATLRKKGILIDDFDMLIGTSAVVNGMIMVTDNVKHLSRIPNIQIENWFEVSSYDSH